ncbi:MAG: hypothetical protein KJO11_16705 [Gemmatimonadetes bacterium]|nr:hypothetical protein [Gemmatimonadota bacterium]MBT8404596.1 hypothetical protein [Gemmatimonadota bacterium]
MAQRCLFCRKSFPANGRFEHLPRGRRIAYDPERGRLWLICGRCFRWSLLPVEDRDAALYELERAARDEATPVARTAHIRLLRLKRILLVRVGDAGLHERAWWRYGRELRSRKASFESRGSRVTAYTFGALNFVGDVLGLSDRDVSIDWQDAPVADVLRWRRFGWAAWHGRATCAYCNSTLRALRYDLSWWCYPLLNRDGELAVGVPCPRCDPWTPEHIYHIEGPGAEGVLRRVLAYQNITGASERLIRDATRAIETSGSPGEFTVDATRQRQTLWRMGQTGTVALEIALSETLERRLLDLEVRAIEFMWRQEEELAHISDEELTPRGVLRKHLRRIPVRISPRRTPRILADRED